MCIRHVLISFMWASESDYLFNYRKLYVMLNLSISLLSLYPMLMVIFIYIYEIFFLDDEFCHLIVNFFIHALNEMLKKFNKHFKWLSILLLLEFINNFLLKIVITFKFFCSLSYLFHRNITFFLLHIYTFMQTVASEEKYTDDILLKYISLCATCRKKRKFLSIHTFHLIIHAFTHQ